MFRLYFILFIYLLRTRAFEIKLDPNYKLGWRVINENKIEFTLSLLIKEGSGFVGLGFLDKGRRNLLFSSDRKVEALLNIQ